MVAKDVAHNQPVNPVAIQALNLGTGLHLLLRAPDTNL